MFVAAAAARAASEMRVIDERPPSTAWGDEEKKSKDDFSVPEHSQRAVTAPHGKGRRSRASENGESAFVAAPKGAALGSFNSLVQLQSQVLTK